MEAPGNDGPVSMAMMEMCPPPHPRGWLLLLAGWRPDSAGQAIHVGSFWGTGRPSPAVATQNIRLVGCQTRRGLPDAAWLATVSGSSFLRSANMIVGPSTSEPAANLESTVAASA